MSELPNNTPQGPQQAGRKPDAAIDQETGLYAFILAGVLAAGGGVAAFALSRSAAKETPTSYTSTEVSHIPTETTDR